jgi:hypothetical protein
MGLVDGVAIVTATDVAELTGEAGLDRLDDGAATLDAACRQATTYLKAWLRGMKQFDPAKLSNVSEGKPIAAHIAAWIRLAGQEDEQLQARGKAKLDMAKELFAMFAPVDSDSLEPTEPKGLPVIANQDRVPFFPPTDNLPPHHSHHGACGPWLT